MVPNRVPGSGRFSDDTGADFSVAELFTVLWDALTDLLGSATAAVLLNRSARRAAAGNPELAELVISRENQEYRYTIPRDWNRRNAGPPLVLRDLVRALRPLLVEMTGRIVVLQLEQIPALRARGIVSVEP
jgi:hypothetical protein